MSFQEIPLNGDEQAYLNRSNNDLFSAIAAYGSVTEEVYKSLNPPEQQAIMDALSPEKQAQLRQYQLDIQKAHETTNVARDVQTGVADVARSTVIVPAAPITDAEINKIQEDTKKAEAERIAAEAVGYTPVDPEALPETPNTAIAIFRLMTAGYYPADAVKMRWWAKGDPTWTSKWILQGFQRGEANLAKYRDRLWDDIQEKRFVANKLDFEIKLKTAADAVIADIDKTINRLPQNKTLQDQLQAAKNSVSKIVQETDLTKRANLLTQFNTHIADLARIARIDPDQMKGKLNSAQRATLLGNLASDAVNAENHYNDIKTKKYSADTLGTTLADDDRKIATAQTNLDESKRIYNQELTNAGIDTKYHGKNLSDIGTELNNRLIAIGDPMITPLGTGEYKTTVDEKATLETQEKGILHQLDPTHTSYDPELRRLESELATAKTDLKSLPKKTADKTVQFHIDEVNAARKAVDDRKAEIKKGPPSLLDIQTKIQQSEQKRLDLEKEYKNSKTQLTKVWTLLGTFSTGIGVQWGDISAKEAILTAGKATRTANNSIRDAAAGISDVDIDNAEKNHQNIDGAHKTAERADKRVNGAPGNWVSQAQDFFMNKSGMSRDSANALLIVLQNQPDAATKTLMTNLEAQISANNTVGTAQALVDLENHLKAHVKKYDQAVKAVETLRTEAQARRDAIKAEITKIESGTLNSQQLEAAKTKITNLTADYNTWVDGQNKQIARYHIQMENIPPDILKLLNGTSYVTNASFSTKLDSMHAGISKADKVAGRVGVGMMGVGAYEITKLMMNATTQEDKEKAKLYAVDAGIGLFGFVPFVGNLTVGAYDIGMAVKMAHSGTDIAGNKVSTGDALLRGGLGAVSLIPFVGQAVRFAVKGEAALKTGNTLIKGGELAGKTAALGFPVLYVSEKMGMTLFEVPPSTVNTTPKTPPAKPAN